MRRCLPRAELETLAAEPRGEAGSLESHKLRKAGRTPGVLFSLPGEASVLVSFESKPLGKLLARVGRTGWACHVFDMQLSSPDGSIQSYRALVRAAAGGERGRESAECPAVFQSLASATALTLAAARPALGRPLACRGGRCTRPRTRTSSRT